MYNRESSLAWQQLIETNILTARNVALGMHVKSTTENLSLKTKQEEAKLTDNLHGLNCILT